MPTIKFWLVWLECSSGFSYSLCPCSTFMASGVDTLKVRSHTQSVDSWSATSVAPIWCANLRELQQVGLNLNALTVLFSLALSQASLELSQMRLLLSPGVIKWQLTKKLKKRNTETVHKQSARMYVKLSRKKSIVNARKRKDAWSPLTKYTIVEVINLAMSVMMNHTFTSSYLVLFQQMKLLNAKLLVSVLLVSVFSYTCSCSCRWNISRAYKTTCSLNGTSKQYQLQITHANSAYQKKCMKTFAISI